MKKWIALLLALTMVTTLAACGETGGNQTPAEGNEPPSESNVQTENTPAAESSTAPSDAPAQEPKPSDEPSQEPEPSDAPVEEEPATSSWTLSLPEPSFEFVTSGSDYADFTCTYDEAAAYVQQLIASGNKYYYISDTDDRLYFGGFDGTGFRVSFNFYKNGEQSYMMTDFLENATGFGTGWATNEFEMLFPEPPFDGWVKEQTDANTYKMELQGGLDTTGADRAKLLDYFRILCGYGFHIEVTESVEGADGQPWDYEWKVTDGHGNTIEFMMDSGWCWITVNKGN